MKKDCPPLTVCLSLSLNGRHLDTTRLLNGYSVASQNLIDLANASLAHAHLVGFSTIDRLALYIANSSETNCSGAYLLDLLSKPIDRYPTSLTLQIELLNRALRLSKSNRLLKLALIWFHHTFAEHSSKDLYGFKIRACETILLLVHRQYGFIRKIEDLHFILPILSDIIRDSLRSLAKSTPIYEIDSKVADYLALITSFSPAMLCRTITVIADFLALTSQLANDLTYSEYFRFLFFTIERLNSFPRPPLVNDSLALRIKLFCSSPAIHKYKTESIVNCKNQIRDYLINNSENISDAVKNSLEATVSKINCVINITLSTANDPINFRLVAGDNVIDFSKAPATALKHAAFIIAVHGSSFSLYQNSELLDYQIPNITNTAEAIEFCESFYFKYALIDEIGWRSEKNNFKTHYASTRNATAIGFIHKNLSLFGGAEHFTQTMLSIYQKLGFDVVNCAHQLTIDKRKDIEDSPNEVYPISTIQSVIELIQAKGIHLFHSIGQFEAFSPIFRFLRVTYICGQHFYWDYKLPVDSESFSIRSLNSGACDNIFMRNQLSSNIFLAPNSFYSRELIARTTEIAFPIIYSIPEPKPHLSLNELGNEIQDNDFFNCSILDKDFIVSVSGQDIKGYRYLIELARYYPLLNILVICNQSSLREARQIALESNVNNIVLTSGIPNHILQSLIFYSRGLLSFSVETFGRVVVEALQLRRMVFCFKDTGAQAYQESDLLVHLPHDMVEAGRIICEKLLVKPDDNKEVKVNHPKLLDGLASVNLFPETMKECIQKFLPSNLSRCLVVVGSGIGNLVQQTPLIKRLSTQYQSTVDILFLGDYRDSWLIFDNPRYVGKVFLCYQAVQNYLAQYEHVIMTRASFSMQPEYKIPFPLNREIVRYPSILENLVVQPYSEAYQHICSFSEFLVNQDADVSSDYFVGPNEGCRSWDDLLKQRSFQKIPLNIGFHGGSKGGVWASKQWPYYKDLVQEVLGRGHNVFSYGLQDEFIDGSIDNTSIPFYELIKRISRLDLFIGNDSGITNLAAGIGIPVLVIFGPTNPVYRKVARPNYRSIGPDDKDCHPCEVNIPAHFSLGKCQCISTIPLKRILSTLQNLLD